MPLLAMAVLLTACQPSALHIVDGDTIDLGGVRYRMSGYDAPELGKARCTCEHELAVRAKQRLRELMSGGYTLQRVPCWRAAVRSCALVARTWARP